MAESKEVKKVEVVITKNARYNDIKLSVGDLCRCTEKVAKELVDAGVGFIEEPKKRRVIEI